MSAPFSYDEVTYPSMVFPHIRPDQIGAISVLHGVTPENIERCRVLELGCGDGTNLLSIAYTMPESHCVGLDLSGPRIDEANEYATAIGIANAEFHKLDLLEYEPGKFGEFDFIIAHGVYSWVPEPVREKVLWILEKSLKPNGVGFISYNLYPGWHIREVTRHAMQFQTELIDEPIEKAKNGVRFVEFLKEASEPNSLYRSLLEKQFTYLEEKVPESIFHDDLSTNNQPFYFRQFIDRIGKSGLQFVSELEPMSFFVDDLPAFAQEALDKVWDDPLRREQYLDFIRGRFFRSTLVCRESMRPSYRPVPRGVGSLYLSSPSRAISSGSSLTDDSAVAFSAPKDNEFEINHPLVKSLLGLLGPAWPKRFSFSEIKESLKVGSDAELEVLQNAAIKLITANIVEVRCFRPQIEMSVSQRPKVSDFARWQAERGFRSRGNSCGVTSMHGADIPVDNELLREQIVLSDGTRDRANLEAAILNRVDGKPGERPAIEPNFSETIESNLEMLARSALLVS